MQFDVCNGDADGLCATVQWRLHTPHPAVLVTGLKRDIALLQQVQAGAGDQVLVCDVSMRRNHAALTRLLACGAQVQYFDHHAPGDIPEHPLLHAHIDTRSSVCTSLLVNDFLGQRYGLWALVGAFGDNLTAVAQQLAQQLALPAHDTQQLRMLGEAINYNAYGESVQDVHIAPERLFEMMVRYADPRVFLAQETVGQELNALRQDDLSRSRGLQPYRETDTAKVYVLPDAPWSRRVMGSLGNTLANISPQCAHALLKATGAGDYVVSVRAPLGTPHGAVDVCVAFGGDGRAGAAGIDHLAADALDAFVDAFFKHPWGAAVVRAVPGGSEMA